MNNNNRTNRRRKYLRQNNNNNQQRYSKMEFIIHTNNFKLKDKISTKELLMMLNRNHLFSPRYAMLVGQWEKIRCVQ